MMKLIINKFNSISNFNNNIGIIIVIRTKTRLTFIALFLNFL